MLPVLGGEVEEGEQDIGILLQVAAFLAERWTRRTWFGWVWLASVSAMIACVYLTLPWFRL
jgi:hypothetical protein